MTELNVPTLPGAAHPNGSPAPAPRPLRRRRGLPNSRALVGGLLVAAAAVGMFAAYLRVAGGSGQQFVVARHAVSVGSRLQPSDLTLERMELPPSLRARAFDDVSVVVGATLLAPLDGGELVQASAVVAQRGEPPSRELSFPVEQGRLSPSLREGERVDVVATFGDGDNALTAVVLPHARVIALDRDQSGMGGTAATVVTLAVDQPADEVALAHAVQLAKLTVVRATGAPPQAGPPPTYRLTPDGGAPIARTTGPSGPR